MKNRTCPNCGYRYSIFEYLKVLRRTWKCKNCGSTLTADFNRRMILILIIVLPAGLGAVAAGALQKIGVSLFMSWLSVVVFMVVWTILISGFEEFELHTKQKQG